MLIQELLVILAEEEAKPIELKDIYAAQKGKTEKAIDKLWGTDKLMYKGQLFFKGTDHDFGPVYEGAFKAAEKVFKKFNTELVFRHESKEVEVELGDRDSQEVYLGWSPTEDKLYMGFDAWLQDETNNGINNAFDDMYHEATGDKYDPDSKDTKYHKAWKEFSDSNLFLGILVELTTTDGKKFTADIVESVGKGFYSGIYNSKNNSEFKRLKLIDLRLD